MTEETGLFHIRFTEKGKQVVKRMANLGLLIMGLVAFTQLGSIYLQIKYIIRLTDQHVSGPFELPFYFRITPWINLFTSILVLVSNFYYAKFPRQLNRCLERNDEDGANQAFQTLLKGMFIFLVILILDTAELLLYRVVR
ncbi:MAG: hypothetical protein JNM88_17955 [Chitinophagaceae bacterium]|nr:hypothetical protein [Chitinophagaceae bacterium]